MLTPPTATEQACAAYLASVGTLPEGTHIFTGMENEKMQTPCVICFGDSATPDFPEGGIWHVTTRISTKEIYSKTEVDSTLASIVQEAMLADDIAERLTANASYLSVLSVNVSDASTQTSGDVWMQTLVLDIVCGLTD